MNGIILHEVGMRDGLQVETTVVPTAQKIAWIERLAGSGLDVVQAGSFVNPKIVPPMADTDALFAHFKSRRVGDVVAPPRARLSGLVLNEKGLERALAAGVDYLCMGVSASETHSRKNTGMSTDEALVRIVAMGKAAVERGAAVQMSVQSAFGCGYEGAVPETRVLRIVDRFVEAGFRTISLADTAGHALPQQVERLFTDIAGLDPDVVCACHLHDTFGLAMANAKAALDAGVRIFESAFGGLGGCPFTAIAGGNLCTEDFVHFLQRLGHRPDVAVKDIIEVTNEAERFFGRQLPGTVHRTGILERAVPV